MKPSLKEAPAPERLPAAREGQPARPDRKIPSILLEGDQPVVPPRAEPVAACRALESSASTQAEGELPEAYGTGRLFLMPRDPRCLCAQWDLSAEQLHYHNARAAGQHLVLRVYLEQVHGALVAELHVHPESRHWFVHVDRPGDAYVGELGYYTRASQWHTLAVSEPAATPAESPQPAAEPVRFATFEVQRVAQLPPAELGEPSGPALPSLTVPIAEHRPGPVFAPAHVPSVGSAFTAARSVESRGREEPIRAPIPGRAEYTTSGPAAVREPIVLTPAQQEALWELAGLSIVRSEWVNSAEIVELISRGREQAVSSAEAAQLEAGPALPAVSISSAPEIAPGEVSSPPGGQPVVQREFWFNVNAELIIYGATEPDATVTIGARTIRLRADGTFSYRFALPDGNYSLPITATSTDGDGRRAELEFYRGTRYTGEVGAHPQDPGLKSPGVENVS